MPPHWGKYMRVTGKVQTSIIRPIDDMLFCVEMLLEPENSSSCVTTAPKVPPLPVMPDITPSDLHQAQHQALFWYISKLSH